VSENKAGSAYKNVTVIVNNGLSNVMSVDLPEEEEQEEGMRTGNSTTDMFEEKQEDEISHSYITSDLIFGAFAGAFIVMTLFLAGMVLFARKRKISVSQRRRSPLFRSHRKLDEEWESELEKLHPFSLTSRTETAMACMPADESEEKMKKEAFFDSPGRSASSASGRVKSKSTVNPLQKPSRLAFQTNKEGE